MTDLAIAYYAFFAALGVGLTKQPGINPVTSYDLMRITLLILFAAMLRWAVLLVLASIPALLRGAL